MYMEIIKLTTGPDRKCDGIGTVVLIKGAVYNGIRHDNYTLKKEEQSVTRWRYYYD